MSLIKRSDVKNHLSARRKTLVFPFGPVKQPDATSNSADRHRVTNPNVPSSGNSIDTFTVRKQQA
jgi:hypothetical protein